MFILDMKMDKEKLKFLPVAKIVLKLFWYLLLLFLLYTLYPIEQAVFQYWGL